MSCQTVHRFISAYLDQLLAGNDRQQVAQHLASCRVCATRLEQFRQAREMLLETPAAPVPPELASQLRVLASHERQRRLRRIHWPTRLSHFATRLRLLTDNLMRPVALPFAGGLVSALFLFGMLVPTLLFQFDFRNDVPTAFYTEPSLVEAGPFASIHDEAVVELTINERGQVTDYSFPSGKLDRHAERSLLADLVLYSRYSPGSLFGYPASGKVVVKFRRGSIVVRG